MNGKIAFEEVNNPKTHQENRHYCRNFSKDFRSGNVLIKIDGLVFYQEGFKDRNYLLLTHRNFFKGEKSDI